MMVSNRAVTFPLLRSAYPWLICCIGMLFYCFNYFLRVSPSVMQNELSQAFHITAYQFGLLSSAYYWAYTPMQIPAGMIYDKFGVRFVLCLASLMGTAGLWIFTSADTFAIAWAGRFLIGLGCAFAYIGILKLASVWLPPNRFAVVAGLATAVGMISGALTQKYITHTVENIGYQSTLHPAIFAGIALSIIIVLFVKDRPQHQLNTSANEMLAPINMKQLFNALRIIFTSRQMWLIGIIGCLLYLPASVFLDAYCKQYLMTVYQISPDEAVNVANLTFVGWIISGPIIGALSDKIKRRCLPLTFTGFFAAVLLCIVFYAHQHMTITSLYAVFFMIGFCCGAHPLCFPLGKENNPIQISGTAVAATNMLIMLGGMIFQPFVGKLLDLHSSAIGPNGLPIYNASDYTFALSVIPIGVAIGIFLSLFIKETHCTSQAKEEDEQLFASRPIMLEPEAEAAK